MTVYQIGENLLGTAALKVNGLSVGSEHIEIAEALYLEQRVVLGDDRESQIVKLLCDILRCDRLHDIAARVKPHRVACVFTEACDEDDIHLRVDLFQLLGKLHAVHTSHVDIQKSDVAAVLFGFVEQVRLSGKRRDIRVRSGFLDRHLEHPEHQWLVVHAQYSHFFFSPFGIITFATVPSPIVLVISTLALHISFSRLRVFSIPTWERPSFFCTVVSKPTPSSEIMTS